MAFGRSLDVHFVDGSACEAAFAALAVRAAIALGAVALGAVTLGAVTLGAVALCAVAASGINRQEDIHYDGASIFCKKKFDF